MNSTCGCGCEFPISPGMSVYVVAGVAYAQRCVQFVRIPPRPATAPVKPAA